MSGEGRGKVGFLHLSFQEYLAAEYAAREGLADDLAGRVTDSWWREVALLSLRCEPSEKYVETFFGNLLANGVLESHVDLASRCIGETIHFPPEPFLAALSRPDSTPAQIASVLRVLRGRQDRVPWLGDWCDKLSTSPHIEIRSIAQEILAAIGRVPIAPVTFLAPEPYSVRVDERTGLTLVWIPAGTFLMGSEKWDLAERPVHEVTLTRGFFLTKYPITNSQYARYLESGDRPATVPEYWDDQRFNQPEQPVVGVSWNEAVAYCQWAGGRLPTEAEWEYACRAGSDGDFCFGDDPAELGDYAWFRENSKRQLQPVGRKKPNAWGLHDMHGNVWEWCNDRFARYRSGAEVDPKGPLQGSSRVSRGGSWLGQASNCRAAFRDGCDPSGRSGNLGFRLLLSPSE
jgi:formylglycine-generating enzyme required for sulfatase activity